VVSARKLNAETMMRTGRQKFLTHPGRLKYDWDLVLRQVEHPPGEEHAHPLNEGMYNMLLAQIEFEREAYRTDLEYMYGQMHRDMHRKHSEQADWVFIRAEHWNQYRATVRERRRWLDEVEERLDETFVRSVRGSGKT